MISRHSNRHAPRNSPGAQGAFKDSMIHWILQFTLLIAFRCVLHRCESQEIRCWKLYMIIIGTKAQWSHSTTYYVVYEYIVLKGEVKQRRAVCFRTQQSSHPDRHPSDTRLSPKDYKMCTGGWIRSRQACTCSKEPATTHQEYSIMILPQVHLRKPCYDFYFL